MKYHVLILGLLCLWGTVPAHAEKLPAEFVWALNQVEAGGRTNGVIIGDRGLARGPLQIHYSYWKDSGVKGKYSDCDRFDYSIRVAEGYLNRYSAGAIRDGDYETLARIHNGGPSGDKKASTRPYWLKVKRYLLASSNCKKKY